MSRAILLVLCVLSGCAYAVQARGPVAAGADGRPWITASNGKARALDVGADTLLPALDGHLVELTGVLRKGVIEVQDYEIEEGVLGLPVFVGYARVDGEGFVWVDDPRSGARYQVLGDEEETVAAAAGRRVVVEGVMEGMMGVRVLRVVVGGGG